MFDQKVIISQQFPVPDQGRKHTDVCCTFLGAIFAISMFVTSLILYSSDSYNEKFKPLDIYTCKAGFLHIPNISDINSKICLNVCPQGYGVSQQNICIPYDTKLQKKYYRNTKLTQQRDYQGFKRTILYTFIVALGVGIMYMVFVFALPKYTPQFAGGGAMLILAIIFLFTVFSTQNFWGTAYSLKVPVIILCLILILIACAMTFFYGDQMKFQAVILKYSNMFLFQNELVFIYIPLFIILTFGLLSLIWFQNIAFQSRFASNYNRWDMTNSGIFGALNIVQLLWGLQFLRDAFNFCVSGNAIYWYWRGETSIFNPVGRLLCRHWGSVVGGSFLNAFFQIPTLIVQLIVCHPEGCLSRAGTFCEASCNPFTSFFDMVRTDAYSYINLSGIPFCNAARNCSYLCQKSNQFIGNHSAIKHYRFLASVFLVGLVSFMTQFILNYRTYSIGFWHIFIGLVIIHMTLTWFIDIHADSAQALQTSYLAQYALDQTHKYMRNIRPSIKAELLFLNNRQKYDGQF